MMRLSNFFLLHGSVTVTNACIAYAHLKYITITQTFTLVELIKIATLH